ncbi:hypothetical protein TNCV_4311051 [Trichonephila clavipes]|nr:hypothetical protein TNCV_4311051 [Trichonephila clavipes]
MNVDCLRAEEEFKKNWGVRDGGGLKIAFAWYERSLKRIECSFMSFDEATGEPLATDFEISNQGQVTRAILELAPHSPNFHFTPM